MQILNEKKQRAYGLGHKEKLGIGFRESYLAGLESEKQLRTSVKGLMQTHLPKETAAWGLYFLVVHHGLPSHWIGGFAAGHDFSGAMSSTSSELSALGSVTAMDFYGLWACCPRAIRDNCGPIGPRQLGASFHCFALVFRCSTT